MLLRRRNLALAFLVLGGMLGRTQAFVPRTATPSFTRPSSQLHQYATEQEGEDVSRTIDTKSVASAAAAAAAADSSKSKHAQNVTLLRDLRPGMRLHGGVVGVTDFAAFLDVHVVRQGPGGKHVRCNAMLHPADVPEGVQLLRDGQPQPLETDPNVIRRGIHVPVYVKDVFPNSGRFSVTLDPSIDKAKVIAARRQKRQASKKRGKEAKKVDGVEEGMETKAQVVKLLRTALLVDIGLPVPAFLPNINIPDSIPLETARRVGTLLTVRVSEKTDKQIKVQALQVLPPGEGPPAAKE